MTGLTGGGAAWCEAALDDYGIGFRQETVEKVAEFPLEGYTLYKNRKSDETQKDSRLCG